MMIRSLIQVLTEPACSAEVCSLIALSPLLEADEMQEMICALPKEYNSMREKGLVHLLPSPLRQMLDGSRIANRLLPSQSRNNNTETRPSITVRNRYSQNNRQVCFDIGRNTNKTRNDTECDYQEEAPVSFFTSPFDNDYHYSSSSQQTNLEGVANESYMTNSRQERLLHTLIEVAGRRIKKFLIHRRNKVYEWLNYTILGGSLSDKFLYVTTAFATMGAAAFKFRWVTEYLPQKYIASILRIKDVHGIGSKRASLNQMAKVAGSVVKATATVSSSILVLRWLFRLLALIRSRARAATTTVSGGELYLNPREVNSPQSHFSPVILLPSKIREVSESGLESFSRRFRETKKEKVAILVLMVSCFVGWKFRSTKTFILWLYKMFVHSLHTKRVDL